MTSTKFGDNGVAIERLEVSAYTVPSDSPESDGTYAWDKTTIVIVEASAGGKCGPGYTYADLSTATLVKTMLCNVIQGQNANLWYFRSMLEANAVDVLQADATRCAGITGFLRVGALCESRSLQLSSHCGPSLHVHPCCAVPDFRHMEYFHDHVRIEHMFFDGVLTPVDGTLRPDLSRPGMGLEFKRADAAKYAV